MTENRNVVVYKVVIYNKKSPSLLIDFWQKFSLKVMPKSFTFVYEVLCDI